MTKVQHEKSIETFRAKLALVAGKKDGRSKGAAKYFTSQIKHHQRAMRGY